MDTGRIILLNGTSSAGKTTLSYALQAQLAEPFCVYASDQLADAGFRPPAPHQRYAGRERFFDGFHRSIPAFAAAGNDLIVEHIVEKQSWADQLATLIGHLDVFWVGVHATLSVLEQRSATAETGLSVNRRTTSKPTASAATTSRWTRRPNRPKRSPRSWLRPGVGGSFTGRHPRKLPALTHDCGSTR